MIDLELNTTNEIKFELVIEGINKPVDELRMTIELGNRSLSFKGNLSDRVATFKLPELAGLMEAGSYPMKLEIFVENHYFNPVKDFINLKKAPQISAKTIKTESTVVQKIVATPVIEEKKIEVKKSDVQVIEETKVEEPQETDALFNKIKSILK